MANSKIVFGGETLIDLSGDSVKKGNLLRGITAHGSDGEPIVGEMDPGESLKPQAKTVTPSKEEQVVTPDDGYNALSQVTVRAIPYSEEPNAGGGTTVTIGG